MNIAFVVLWALGGFISAQIAQRVVVPILVRMLGEKRFASPSAFDGCSLGIVGAFAAMVLPVVFTAKRGPFHASPLWTFPLVALGITIYGLIWLWSLGHGARQREWRIENGRIFHRNGEELRPAFVRERSNYFQTDAFNGYSHYFLDLHDDEKLLGTNAYTSEEEFERERKAVDELARARRLDLIWLHRVEPKKWQYVRFPDEWTPVLCGPLKLLNEDDQAWWRAWTLPDFAPGIGTEININDAQERLERLRAAYPELQTPPDKPDAILKSVGRVWVDTNFDLDRLLVTNGPVIALDNARFQELSREAVAQPNRRVQLLHNNDGFAILS